MGAKTRVGAGVGTGVAGVLCAIGFCGGLPLIAAAGLSAAGLAWIGGIAAGAAALAVMVVALLLRWRRRGSSTSCAFSAKSTEESVDG